MVSWLDGFDLSRDLFVEATINENVLHITQLADAIVQIESVAAAASVAANLTGQSARSAKATK